MIPATQEAGQENRITQKAEVAVSRDRTTALQPGQQRERLCLKKQKQEQKQKNELMFHLNTFLKTYFEQNGTQKLWL